MIRHTEEGLKLQCSVQCGRMKLQDAWLFPAQGDELHFFFSNHPFYPHCEALLWLRENNPNAVGPRVGKWSSRFGMQNMALAPCSNLYPSGKLHLDHWGLERCCQGFFSTSITLQSPSCSMDGKDSKALVEFLFSDPLESIFEHKISSIQLDGFGGKFIRHVSYKHKPLPRLHQMNTLNQV